MTSPSSSFYDRVQEGQPDAEREPGRVLAGVPGFPVGHGEVYKRFAPQYDLLCLRQDARTQSIAAAVHALLVRAAAAAGGAVGALTAVDVGTGTGKLAALLGRWGVRVVGVDRARPMLTYACVTARRAADGVQAAGARLPLRDKCVDVALAGWTLSETKSAHFDRGWRAHIDRSVAELARVARHGVLVLENLAVGAAEPARAGSHLYRHLVENAGFERAWHRTDYVFASLDEALRLTRFFFGTKRAAAWEPALRAQHQALQERHHHHSASAEADADAEDHDPEPEQAPEPEPEPGIVLPECTAFFWRNL